MASRKEPPEKRLSALFSWRGAISSKHGPTSPTRRHVLLVLSLHMNEKGGSAFPSTRTLAEETGLSRRAVETHLRIAGTEGWLSSEKVKTNRQHGWLRTIYRAQIPISARLDGNDVPTVVDGEPGSPRDRLVGNLIPLVGNLVRSRGEGGSPEDVIEDAMEDGRLLPSSNSPLTTSTREKRGVLGLAWRLKNICLGGKMLRRSTTSLLGPAFSSCSYRISWTGAARIPRPWLRR